MPVYAAREEAVVGAGPAECFAAMTDFARIPEWQGAVRGRLPRSPGRRSFERRADGRTDVALDLATDPGRLVPRPVATLVQATVGGAGGGGSAPAVR